MKTISFIHPKIALGLVLSLLIGTTQVSLAHETAGKNLIHSINVNYELYQLSKNDLEGYSEQIGGGMYTYPSLRDDVRHSMITRASTGKAGFEFYTSPVPADYKDDMVHFFFYSDIDLNNLEPYDIQVNGSALLSILPDEKGNLQIIENPGNGNASFYMYRRDVNGDGQGAFRLSVPVSMLSLGQKARISVYGQARGTNAWFMLFKEPHAIQWLRDVATQDVSFSVKQFNDKLLIDAPAHLAGEKVMVVSDGKESALAEFQQQGEVARASVIALAPREYLYHQVRARRVCC